MASKRTRAREEETTMTTNADVQRSNEGIFVFAMTAYAMMVLSGLGTAVAIFYGVAWGAVAMATVLALAISGGRLLRSTRLDPLNLVLGTMGSILVLALVAAAATIR
jgi:hypothetical protein